MHRVVIAVVLTLILASSPTRAQLFPTQQPAASDAQPERTLIDATVYVEPPTDGAGLCIGMPPGKMTVTVKRVTDAIEERPTRFWLYGFMADPDAIIEMPVTDSEATISRHVTGSDHYCWGLDITAPEAANMDHAHRGAYVQTVAVKITHRPD